MSDAGRAIVQQFALLADLLTLLGLRRPSGRDEGTGLIGRDLDGLPILVERYEIRIRHLIAPSSAWACCRSEESRP